MCGHAIIAITKVVLETGMMPVNEPETIVKIEAPAGLITAHARCKDGHVTNVYFHNVPSFVLMRNQKVNVPNIGQVDFDIAFGGAFYAFVNFQFFPRDRFAGFISKINYQFLGWPQVKPLTLISYIHFEVYRNLS